MIINSGGGGGGSNLTLISEADIDDICSDISGENVFVSVDNALSSTSENPVQNKIITNKLNKTIALADGIAIAADTDLNDITTIGNYYCASSAIAQTLTNCPIVHWFTMRVGYTDLISSNWQYQEIIDSSNGTRYYRYHAGSGGTWQAWQKTLMDEGQFYQSASVNATTEWNDSGISYTPTKTGWYLIEGYCSYSNAQPIGVAIAYEQSSSVWSPYAIAEKGSWHKTIGALRCSGCVRVEANMTLHLITKYAAASSTGNPMALRVTFLKD